MCSAAPSRVVSARPETEIHFHGSPSARTKTETCGFRSISLGFARPSAVLKTTCSPSQSIHVNVWCGVPSARSVATTA